MKLLKEGNKNRKIEVIMARRPDHLKETVNKFIKDKKVIDITIMSDEVRGYVAFIDFHK